MAVKILIADDHEIVRQGIRRVLEVKPEWEICGEASNGQEAVRMAQELSPDIIIMDVTMPVMAGSVRKSGAHGYVVKSRAAQDLVQALERLLRGGTFFDSGMYAH